MKVIIKMYQNIEIQDQFPHRQVPHSQIQLHETWSAIEASYFQKLQQQRYRMESMAMIIEQYAEMLKKTEIENEELKEELEKLGEYRELYEQAKIMNKGTLLQYQDTLSKLSDAHREIAHLQNLLEETLKQIPAQYPSPNSLPKPGYLYSTRKSPNSNMHTLMIPPTQTYHTLSPNFIEEQLMKDHTTLQEMYEQLKHQTLTLQKQNVELKQVISDQSKLYYEFKEKQPEPEKEKEKPIIPIPSVSSIQKTTVQRQDSENSENKQNGRKETKIHHPNDVLKIKQLKKQLKKQNELIDRYRQNEQQQLELIEMLKTQNSRHMILGSNQDLSKKLLSR